ncbi:EIN3-binding F-box protein 1-like [Phoenix dactylifera]|uniref:EIN3-binding F-box protein 1-like n=1 Tax=Phoenix dactylifera TaxID=42345 RepID=A0A8B7CSW3_PHODC|nr:EIN3-binding F-box protein 1-like [Phoenix dactylifera]
MPALVKYGGSDDLCPAGPLFSNLMDSSLLLSLAPNVDVFCPPRKRSRVTAPFVFKGGEKGAEKPKQKLCSIDVLPDECLFEILRRLPGSRERSNSACVSKRWLMLLSSIRASEIAANKKNGSSNGDLLKNPLPDLNDAVSTDEEEEPEKAGYLTRYLKAKEATDVRLAAMAVGVGGHGGLGKLYIQGSNATRPLTDTGLSAVAHACPSLRVLSMWNIPFISDVGLSEIANGCPMLEKLDLCRCPSISDKGLIAVARKCPKLTSLTIESCSSIGNEGLHAIGRCCPKLKSIIIKDCPGVGDRGVASLVSAASSSLARIDLQSINISDASLAVIGHYGKAVADLALTGLQYVSERGFWVMSNALGLQKLKSITIDSCNGVTDLGLEAIAKGCPSLKQLFLSRCCYLSDSGLKLFAQTARALENLHLEECNRISLIGVLGFLLSCNAKFRALSLVKCFGINDTSFCPSPLPSCMSLRSLTIRDCPGFTGTSLAVVGKICPQLQHVDLSGLVGATDAGLLPLIESSVGLVTVNLSGCVDLTDAAITALAKAHGTTLQMLNLESCKNVTDKSLLAIADCCSLLDDLDMSRCTISDHGVAVLAYAMQLKLRVLSLAGCSGLTQKSLPFLGNMGRSLVGLNLQNCNLISTQGIGALEEKLWWCDILY